MATLNLMAAAEFTYQEDERLVSRWPAIVLLILTATGLLAWMPLALTMPVREVGLVYASKLDAGRDRHRCCSAASPSPSSCSP